eukprot:1161653-Pelagomonas_calceolata.AAC.5
MKNDPPRHHNHSRYVSKGKKLEPPKHNATLSAKSKTGASALTQLIQKQDRHYDGRDNGDHAPHSRLCLEVIIQLWMGSSRVAFKDDGFVCARAGAFMHVRFSA